MIKFAFEIGRTLCGSQVADVQKTYKEIREKVNAKSTEGKNKTPKHNQGNFLEDNVATW